MVSRRKWNVLVFVYWTCGFVWGRWWPAPGSKGERSKRAGCWRSFERHSLASRRIRLWKWKPLFRKVDWISTAQYVSVAVPVAGACQLQPRWRNGITIFRSVARTIRRLPLHLRWGVFNGMFSGHSEDRLTIGPCLTFSFWNTMELNPLTAMINVFGCGSGSFDPWRAWDGVSELRRSEVFFCRCLVRTMAIIPGCTLTYGDIWALWKERLVNREGDFILWFHITGSTFVPECWYPLINVFCLNARSVFPQTVSMSFTDVISPNWYNIESLHATDSTVLV